MKSKTIIPVLLVLGIIPANSGAAKKGSSDFYAALGHENNQMLNPESGIQANAVQFSGWDLECLFAAAELPLTLEPWMTVGTKWEIQDSEEKPLELEPWMLEDKNWKPVETGTTGVNQERSENGWPEGSAARMNFTCLPQEFEGHVGSECWKTDDHVWCNEYSVIVFTNDDIGVEGALRGCKGLKKLR